MKPGHYAGPFRLYSPHLVIGRFARQAGYPGPVISRSQDSRSFVSPLEQVGEHPGGAGGCLASAGNAGIAAGCADTGKLIVGRCAHPVIDSASASHISGHSRVLLPCILSHLIDGALAPLFFLSLLALVGGLGLRLLRLQVGPLLAPAAILCALPCAVQPKTTPDQ
nr:hypothetical protein [Pseudomonas urethralis]